MMPIQTSKMLLGIVTPEGKVDAQWSNPGREHSTTWPGSHPGSRWSLGRQSPPSVFWYYLPSEADALLVTEYLYNEYGIEADTHYELGKNKKITVDACLQ